MSARKPKPVGRFCALCRRPVNRGGGKRSKLPAEHHHEGRRCNGSDLPWLETFVPGPPAWPSAEPAPPMPDGVVAVDFVGARIARVELGRPLTRAEGRAFVLRPAYVTTREDPAS